MEDNDLLRVTEAFQQDVGYGRARINTKCRNKLDLHVGDVIEIIGDNKASAMVWRAHPADEGRNFIRIDQNTVDRAGVKIDDLIKIK